jgi:hypothetical protein
VRFPLLPALVLLSLAVSIPLSSCCECALTGFRIRADCEAVLDQIATVDLAGACIG